MINMLTRDGSISIILNKYDIDIFCVQNIADMDISALLLFVSSTHHSIIMSFAFNFMTV